MVLKRSVPGLGPLGVLLLTLAASIDCGSDGGSGTGGSASTGGGGGGSLEACDGLPSQGEACPTDGEICTFPGSPCGGVATCTSGTWDVEVTCPPPDECPLVAPTDGEPCSLSNPAAGSLICDYPCPGGTGSLTATCNDTSWFIAPCPGGGGGRGGAGGGGGAAGHGGA